MAAPAKKGFENNQQRFRKQVHILALGCFFLSGSWELEMGTRNYTSCLKLSWKLTVDQSDIPKDVDLLSYLHPSTGPALRSEPDPDLWQVHLAKVTPGPVV